MPPHGTARLLLDNPQTSDRVLGSVLAAGLRDEMGVVITDWLDQEQRCFTGCSFSDDRRYETPGIWTRSGGSLGLDMFRLDRGATEVYLQIATNREAAVRRALPPTTSVSRFASCRDPHLRLPAI